MLTLRRVLLSACVGFLVVLGVSAAYGRSVHVSDWLSRVEPLRDQLFERFRIVDPFAAERAAEVDRFDRRFRDHPRLALLHTVPGGLFLAFAVLQFSSRIRNRFVAFHRWSGRALIAAAFATAVPALYFGVLTPYGGLGEAAAIALFAALFLVSITRAYLAIRRRDIVRHRQWMIRAFAIGIGISTVRVVGFVFDVTLTPAGLRPAAIFVISIWTGWIVTAGAAELWIRKTHVATQPSDSSLRATLSS